MKKYRAKFNPNKKGVYAVSLVTDPAMEGDFIQFEKENKLQFVKVDESKRRVMGLILEPNKEVLRFNKQTNTPYSVFFEKEDVEAVAYNFQKQGNQNNSTLQHDGTAIEGVSFVETWIVENPKVDKSTNFGFEYPKGSWMGVMQLDNEEVWNEYVKTGIVKGFSIDAFMQFEEVNFKKVDMSKKEEGTILEMLKELPTKIVALMKPTEKVEVKETPESKEAVELTEEVEAVEAVEVKETPEALNRDQILESLVNSFKEIVKPIQEESVALKKELDALEIKLSKQNDELVELGKSPATKSVNSAPKQLEYAKMSNYQKYLYNKNKK